MNPPIRLSQAAKYYQGLSHQTAAWNWLEEQIPDKLAQFAELYRADPPAPKAPATPGDWLALCLPLVQSFEGCRLDAYPDPGTGGDPWTIGLGTTVLASGRRVMPGDRISQAQADQLLSNRLQSDWQSLAGQIPGWGKMRPGQQAALVSFAYNVGNGFYGAPGFNTISKAISSGNWAEVPAALMLYINPGSPVEAGLRRRREAEGKLWAS